MKKTILSVMLLLTCVSYADVKNLDATYSVSYGLFGKLGISEAHLDTDGTRYSIEVSAKTTGIVKRLSQNRQEHYISQGHVVDGMLVSDSLEVRRSHGDKVSIKRYSIDHKKKEVVKSYIKKRAGKIYQNDSEILDFYSKDDLLTLYFNLSKIIDLKKSGTYALGAVGAEKQQGKISIVIPDTKHLALYEKVLGKGEFDYLTAIVYQKLFQSNRGELMLVIGKDGIAEKAVLKDLILYGDLTAKRIR